MPKCPAHSTGSEKGTASLLLTPELKQWHRSDALPSVLSSLFKGKLDSALRKAGHGLVGKSSAADSNTIALFNLHTHMLLKANGG